MAKTSAPINVIIYLPKTEEGKRELAQRVADVHTDFVHQYIKNLKCPSKQKERLLDAVINDASSNCDIESNDFLN